MWTIQIKAQNNTAPQIYLRQTVGSQEMILVVVTNELYPYGSIDNHRRLNKGIFGWGGGREGPIESNDENDINSYDIFTDHTGKYPTRGKQQSTGWCYW